MGLHNFLSSLTSNNFLLYLVNLSLLSIVFGGFFYRETHLEQDSEVKNYRVRGSLSGWEKKIMTNPRLEPVNIVVIEETSSWEVVSQSSGSQ